MLHNYIYIYKSHILNCGVVDIMASGSELMVLIMCCYNVSEIVFSSIMHPVLTLTGTDYCTYMYTHNVQYERCVYLIFIFILSIVVTC